MSGAIAAVFQVLCSPFSPRRRGNGGNDNDEGSTESGGGAVGNVGAGSSESDGNDNDEDSTMVVAGANNVGSNSPKKRKRKEQSTTTAWGAPSKFAKKEMEKRGELHQYFQSSLEKVTSCGNKDCSCLKILKNDRVRSCVAEYLVWFEKKNKYDQDSIILDWYRYAHQGKGRKKLYMLPYKSNGDGATSSSDPTMATLRDAKVCSKGIQKVTFIGKSRFDTVASVSKTSGVMPVHKHTGRIAPNAVIDEKRTKALKDHFESLLSLGEVRATRVISTLVDGEQGRANREDTTDMVYLPLSFGFRPCYKRYMEALGYDVTCRLNGGVIVEGFEGKAVDTTEFVSFTTYCRKWRTEYPQLKVSKPVEDICQYCFVFANRHRYLANHSAMDLCVECDDDGDDIDVVRPSALNDLDLDGRGGEGGQPNPDINAECIDTTLRASEFISGAEKERPTEGRAATFPLRASEFIDATERDPGARASTTVQEEREILLLECALHIKMARAQRSLYQVKIELAISDARLGTVHCKRTYTFVVDFGQNMDMPVYNKQQPGCTYYYSPLSVYNLGVVNHGHVDKKGGVGAHMYAHVYHEGVGKKGANNVASLIIKTLNLLNLLQENSPGEELNIIFDNCSGQNKNNTVLKLAAWLKAMGYFKRVNFIFLIVGHTKNAADRLFNSLKHEYRKKNLYTMEMLVKSLSKSESVTVLPTEPDDFFDYDTLFKGLFRDLSGRVKKNHIFSCTADDRMDLQESNTPDHNIYPHKLFKKGRLINNATDLKKWTEENLKTVECSGLNPYKMVELWRNYRPHVPKTHRTNILYRKPDARALSVVKEEKVERSVFRKKLKEAKAAGMKERLESIAYLDDDGNDMLDGGIGDTSELLRDSDTVEREVSTMDVERN